MQCHPTAQQVLCQCQVKSCCAASNQLRSQVSRLCVGLQDHITSHHTLLILGHRHGNTPRLKDTRLAPTFSRQWPQAAGPKDDTVEDTEAEAGEVTMQVEIWLLQYSMLQLIEQCDQVEIC